jgi:signal transduction histidine kinase
MDIPYRDGADILRKLILESQLELSESGITVIDENEKIVYLNKRFLDIWELDEAEVKEKDRVSIVEEISDKLVNPVKFREKLRQAYSDKEYQGTDVIEFKDGKLVERKTLTLKDEEGQYHGRIWYFTDITQQRKREEELESYTSELQRMVSSRTQELIEAEKMAASGSLASEIAHDLRSPLQSIRNAAYMMNKDPKKFEVGLEIIEKSVLRSIEMLEAMRSSTRQAEPKLRRTDLNNIIRESVEELPKPENISVQVEIDTETEAWIDGPHIRRVFDNLLLNAVEAMPNGGVITITKQRDDNKFIIQISDTGVGIPEEVLPNLFERKFYTTKPHGLGLGLSYCKRTIESHGGSIMVDSVLGKGTIFTIELPRIV